MRKGQGNPAAVQEGPVGQQEGRGQVRGCEEAHCSEATQEAGRRQGDVQAGRLENEKGQLFEAWAGHHQTHAEAKVEGEKDQTPATSTAIVHYYTQKHDMLCSLYSIKYNTAEKNEL